jgi:hypothetical protein
MQKTSKKSEKKLLFSQICMFFNTKKGNFVLKQEAFSLCVIFILYLCQQINIKTR